MMNVPFSGGTVKVKPAIYKISFPANDKRQSWGWVMLDELAEIVGCPQEKKEELLLLERVGRMRWRWSGVKDKLIRTAKGDHKTTSIENISSCGIMFVPAGWALAVIEEMPDLRDRLANLVAQKQAVEGMGVGA